MPNGHNRRTILRRGAVLGLGAVGIGGIASRAAAAASSGSSPAWHTAVVSGVRDGSVQVERAGSWFRLEGFPAGWQVAVGDKVAVAPALTGSGVSAQPVSHWTTMSAAPATLRTDAHVGGGAGPVMEPATVVQPSLAAKRQRGARTAAPLRVAVADRASSGGADRVIAIREA
jgi:hypothetical protein